MKTENSNPAPITASWLREFLAPAKGAPRPAVSGSLQRAAELSAGRNRGNVLVMMNGSIYHLIPHPHEPAMLALVAEVRGTLSGRLLTWGHCAFATAVANDEIRFA